jgi:HlyD family secretion protein
MAVSSVEQKNVLFFSVCLISFPLLLLVGLFVWANHYALEESVPGTGQLVPEGSIRVVMAPNVGVVRKVFVEKNQTVKAGQVLMELDPEQSLIEKQSLKQQIDLLRDESLALQAAFQRGRGGPTSMVQKAWLVATQQALSSELSQAQHAVDQAQQAIQETGAQLSHSESVLASMEDQRKRYHSLYEEGGIPLVEVQDFDEKVTRARGEVATLRATYKVRQAELAQARKRPAELIGNYNKQLLGELASHQRNIAQLESNEALNQVSLQRMVIRAPVDGVIHEQGIYGPGDVVPNPGEKLFSIVPADAKLVAEVKVTNRDLSYIHLNQMAALRLDALPYQQFGRLNGKVAAISPSTITDAEGNPYYLVRIVPDKLVMEDTQGQPHSLKAGMTVTADIVTRERSIISFLTEPVQSQLDSAFRDPSTR